MINLVAEALDLGEKLFLKTLQDVLSSSKGDLSDGSGWVDVVDVLLQLLDGLLKNGQLSGQDVLN